MAVYCASQHAREAGTQASNRHPKRKYMADNAQQNSARQAAEAVQTSGRATSDAVRRGGEFAADATRRVGEAGADAVNRTGRAGGGGLRPGPGARAFATGRSTWPRASSRLFRTQPSSSNSLAARWPSRFREVAMTSA